MKNPNLISILMVILTCVFVTGCQTKEHYELYPPGDDWVYYRVFELQNMDQLKYWQNSQNIRLQSGVIHLYPDNNTYIKKFIGAGVEPGYPAEVKWSIEESGKFIFSPDSAFLLFSNDRDTAFYFPGYISGGIYHQPRMEQQDSLWYSDFTVAMGVSGKFIYFLKPG